MTIQQFEQTYREECIDFLTKQVQEAYVSTRWLFRRIMKVLKRKLGANKEYPVHEIWDNVKHQMALELSQQRNYAIQNFGISASEFQEMKEQLKEDNKTLFWKYFLSSHQEIIKFLKGKRKISSQQAFSVSSFALVEFMKQLPNDKIYYGNLNALLFRIADNIFLDRIKGDQKRNAVITSRGTLPIGKKPLELKPDEHDKISIALALLGDPCQTILRSHYYKNITLKIIALKMGKSEVGMRKQKERCIKKLRTIFNNLSL